MNKIRLLSEVSCINVNTNLTKLILIFYRSLKRYKNNVGLPAAWELNLQNEHSDDYPRAEKIQHRKGEIVNTRKLSNVLQEQTLIGNFKNDFRIFISKTHCTLYKNKCWSLVQMSTSIWNQKCIRYYSVQAKKKHSHDGLLTCKKEEGQQCSFNKSKEKKETVPCPVPKEEHKQKSETTKIPDSKDICTKKVCNNGTNQDKEETCKKRETQTKNNTLINKITKSHLAQKELKSDKKLHDKKLHHKAKCKICKPDPQFKLYRFRPPPTWKVWLYSFLGVSLKTSKIGLSILKCCKIIPPEDVTWVKLKEYPKPVLEPSRNHLSKGPGKKKIIKSNDTKVDDMKNPCKKEPSKTSLQKDTKTKQQKDTTTKVQKQKDTTKDQQQKDKTAKWAIQRSDTKATATGDKKTDQLKKCEKKLKTDKPSTPSKELTSSRVDSIQETTSDFCKTLIDLCGGKTTSSCNLRKKQGGSQQSSDKIKPIGNNKQLINSVPCDKTKQVCDKKVNTKEAIQPIPQKRNNNSLETTEEFRKKKYEKPKMPEHYTRGAGEIERKLLENQKTFPHKVEFRYRDHCKRKPEEKIQGVHK